MRPSTGGLRGLFTGGSTTGMTDGELLERFRLRTGPADAAAESAFEALVDRHAAMVWGVCRRSLDRSDAEDAFQATFLVLVRKAGSIRVDDRGSAGRWLYGVARKVAARVRSEARKRLPAVVEPTADDDPATLAERRDVRDAVADELDRLPPKYRRPIELCDFEGLTYEQAGVSLGWPTATIKSRLARGRSRLRSRLERRGLAPTAGVVLIEFARGAQAGVPKSLTPSTLRTVALASGLVPGAVARLAEGVVRAMLLQKLKPLALLLAAGAATAAVAVARPPQEAAPKPPAAPSAPADRPDRAPRFARVLATGETVEVVGVSTFPPGPKTWWRPDGAPIETAPCDPFPYRPSEHVALLAKELIELQLAIQVPADLDTKDFQWRVDDWHQTTPDQAATRDGEPVPGLKTLYVSIPRGLHPTSLTVRFDAPAGAWRSLGAWDNHHGGVISSIGDRSLIFSDAVESNGGTMISFAHGLPPSVPIRIVAFDREGREFEGESAGGGWARTPTGESFGMLGRRFQIPLADVAGFRVQARLVENLVIPDIALKPRPADDPR